MRTAITQDLSPDLDHFDYAKWCVLENKTNATSHVNIDSMKAAIEEECYEMSEEFILKAHKSFRRRIDTIIEKIVAILFYVCLLYGSFISPEKPGLFQRFVKE